ncbi:hypothetical protein BH18THE1_BH18THE1_01730 [soil metagenome]
MADRTIPDEFTSGENRSLVGDGRNIKAHIRYLHKNDAAGLSTFKQIANEFMGISDIRIDQSNSDVLVKRVGLKSEFDLSKLSAGEKQLLILLDALVIQRADSIYLVEEPESHVHSSAQKKLLRAMFESSEKSQFFITTHSPVFFKQAEGISNYLVKKTNGKSHVKRVESQNQIREIKKQVGIDNIDALKSNFILFVEGNSEVQALRKMGELVRYAPLSFIPIIPYEGSGNFAGLKQFIKYATNLELTPIVIADGHRNMKGLQGLRILPNSKYEVKQGGRGSKICYVLRNDGEEFEDQFDSKLIVDAMKKVYNDIQCNFDTLESKLITERKIKKVSNILENFLGTTCKLKKSESKQTLLRKTDLAKTLSNIILSDIAKNPNRQKTDFEKKELDMISKWLK